MTRLLFLRARPIRSCSANRSCTPRFPAFDRGEDALEQRILLHAAEECPPLRPIHADRRDLRAAGAEGRFEDRHHFARREFGGALPREEFGDAFVARDVTFAAEHAPVHRQRGQAERAAVMRERIEEGIGRAVVALRRIAEDAGDRREHDEAIERHIARPFVQQPCAVAPSGHHGAIRSRLSAESGASSMTIARWKTPRSG